jgi:hypothetical protein
VLGRLVRVQGACNDTASPRVNPLYAGRDVGDHPPLPWR